MSLTTSLSLAEAVVVRLLARFASYPCLFAGLRQCPLAATYPAPGSYTLLPRRLASPRNHFLSGVDVFPRVRISIPRVAHSSHESRAGVGRSATFCFAASRILWSAYYPWDYRYPERPNRLPSRVRTPNIGILRSKRLDKVKLFVLSRPVDPLALTA